MREKATEYETDSSIKSTKESSRAGSLRRLRLGIVALAIAIIVIVPLVIQPNPGFMDPNIVIFLPKIKLLLGLAAAMLIAMLGATLLGDRPAGVAVLPAALAFLGVSAVSTLLSGNVMDSLVGRWGRFDGLLALAAGVLLFYATARYLDSWRKVRVFLVATVAAAVLVSVHGILQIFGADPVVALGLAWPEETDRAFSAIGWPISLAAYLTLTMGAALALYFLSERRWQRWLWLAALALMAVCWIYTYSRGPMIAFALTLPVVLFFARRRLGTVRPLILPVAIVAVAMLAASVSGSESSTNVVSRILGTNLAPTVEEVPEGGDASITTRLMMWRDTIPVIAERPLLGHGPDDYAEPFARHEGEDLRAFFGEAIVDKAHNETLQVAATTGLLGLAAYIWVFVSYFRHALRSGGWPLLALSGSVLAYILQLQTWITTLATGVTFWAILGVSVAMMRLQQTASELPEE